MRFFLRALALSLVASASSGCALPYYWQAIGGQIGILRHREPIAEVLADPNQDPKVKDSLRSVEEMRRVNSSRAQAGADTARLHTATAHTTTFATPGSSWSMCCTCRTTTAIRPMWR